MTSRDTLIPKGTPLYWGLLAGIGPKAYASSDRPVEWVIPNNLIPLYHINHFLLLIDQKKFTKHTLNPH